MLSGLKCALGVNSLKLLHVNSNPTFGRHFKQCCQLFFTVYS